MYAISKSEFKPVYFYECKEYVDKALLSYIIETVPVSQLGDMADERGKGVDRSALLTRMKKWLRSLNDDGYKKVQYIQKSYGGRLWPQQEGLTLMSKYIRHTCAREHHIDIDMTSAHPTILSYLCKKHSIPCDTLDEFIKDKEKYRPVKTNVLAIINGRPKEGSYLVKEYPLLSDLLVEMKNVRERFTKIYPKQYAGVLKRKPKDYFNPEGALVSFVMTEMENLCLSVCIKTFEKAEVPISSLAYDGLTVPKKYIDDNKVDLDGVIHACESNMKKLLDIDMGLRVKPMDHILDMKPMPDDWSLRCRCPADHADLNDLFKRIIDDQKIEDTEGYNFKQLVSVVNSIASGVCRAQFLRGICLWLRLDPDDDDVLQSLHSDKTEKCIEYCLSLFDKRAKKNKPIVSILKNIQRVMEPVSEKYVYNAGRGFEDGYYLFDLVSYCRVHRFENRTEALAYVIEYGSRCIAEVQEGPMFVYHVNDVSNPIGMAGIKQGCCNAIQGYVRYFGTGEDGKKTLQSEPLVKMILSPEYRASTRFYEKKTFMPDTHNCPDTYFNSFIRYKAEDVKEVDMDLIQPILYHIKECWSNGNEDLYDYILQWLRHAWLYPWERTGAALFLYSKDEGTGKTILLDNFFIKYIYGDQLAVATIGLGPITQRFNSIAMDKKLIVCNEVFVEGQNVMATHSALKSFLTDKSIVIEKKGIDIQGSYPNMADVIMTSNGKFLPMGWSDRRHGCFEVSSRFRGNGEYFDNLLASCNQTVANHFYTYIRRLQKTRDIRKLPETDLKKELQTLSLSSVDAFIQEHVGRSDNDEHKETFTASLVYSHYKNWCTTNKYKVVSNAKFGVGMKECKDVGVARPKSTVYIFVPVEGCVFSKSRSNETVGSNRIIPRPAHREPYNYSVADYYKSNRETIDTLVDNNDTQGLVDAYGLYCSEHVDPPEPSRNSNGTYTEKTGPRLGWLGFSRFIRQISMDTPRQENVDAA
jgi:hypothetical protein